MKPWTVLGKIRAGNCPIVAAPPSAWDRIEWCRTCQQDVSVEVATGDYGGAHVYRKRCRRCGGVIAYGISRADLLTASLTAAAMRFVAESGRDRR